MYHPSLFNQVPKKLGVYALRRRVDPYWPKTGTRTVNRVAVVGYSGNVHQTLKQYFCEHTRTAMTANYRNAAMAIREQVTHIDCYFEPEIMIGKCQAKAFERILTEELEPMLRPPQDSDNIGKEAVDIAQNEKFKNRVMSVIGSPSYTIRLPNRDNVIADLLEQNPELYGPIVQKKMPDLGDY